jgi:hypothetical protein
MFKRYLPGTKKLSPVKMPQIRPIEIGYAKYGETTGPLFRRTQSVNSEPPFSAPNPEDIYQKNTTSRPKKYGRARKEKIIQEDVIERPARTRASKPGMNAYNKRLAAENKKNLPDGSAKLPSFRVMNIKNPGAIPEYANNIKPRLHNRGRPEGSKNKKGTKIQYDEKSDKVLSSHATGRYKKNHKPGKPVTIRVLSKFATHKVNKLDSDGNIVKNKSGKPEWVTVKTSLTWRDLSPFHAYKSRPLPSGYDESPTSGDRSLIQDSQRQAKLPGFRISKEGQREIYAIRRGRSQWTVPQVLKEHGYYEYRRNRADAKSGRKEVVVIGNRRTKLGWL